MNQRRLPASLLPRQQNLRALAKQPEGSFSSFMWLFSPHYSLICGRTFQSIQPGFQRVAHIWHSSFISFHSDCSVRVLRFPKSLGMLGALNTLQEAQESTLFMIKPRCHSPFILLSPHKRPGDDFQWPRPTSAADAGRVSAFMGFKNLSALMSI